MRKLSMKKRRLLVSAVILVGVIAISLGNVLAPLGISVTITSGGMLSIGSQRVVYASPDEVYEYYTTGADGQLYASDSTYWIAQTFTAPSAFAVNQIRCKISKQAVIGFTVYVSLRAVDEGGLPTGGDLSVAGSTVGGTLPETSGPNGVWRYFDIGDYECSNGTTYAIVMSTDTSGQYVRWDRDNDAGYANGKICYSTNSGSSWESPDTFGEGDRIFEIWGYDGGLYEHYNTGDDGFMWGARNNYAVAQSFTAIDACKVVGIKVKALRANNPGTITVGIKNVDGEGKPTGAWLAYGEFNANTMTTNTGGAWYEISTTSYDLSSSTQYSVVMDVPSGDANNYVMWRHDGTDPTYTGGCIINMNAGVWQTPDTTRDRMFEIWGETIEPDISNTPSSKAFGAVAESTSYWSDGSEPTWPLDDGECYFTVTNNGDTCSITVKATNFTGGNGWTLTSGSPGSGTVRMKAGKSGDALETNMVTLTTGEQSFISGLAGSATKKWEIKLETGIFTDGAVKTSTITLTATLD